MGILPLATSTVLGPQVRPFAQEPHVLESRHGHFTSCHIHRSGSTGQALCTGASCARVETWAFYLLPHPPFWVHRSGPLHRSLMCSSRDMGILPLATSTVLGPQVRPFAQEPHVLESRHGHF